MVGYDSLNEPLAGFIGQASLNQANGELSLGDGPTPFQAMLLGSGISQEVEVWKMGLLGLERAGRRRLNERGVRAWQDGRECIWKQHGVWGIDASGAPRLLRPDYFTQVKGRKIDFNQDYYVPFLRRCASAILAADPGTLIFT